ncbi:metallophosphoesterase [Hymenobacter sp. BT683]|uniref:Metallophosphoesterase n=1 Tax=Hymenobacter jeongseonensis TaxID=2791027 RepID=A0ABS0IMU2_9BACT|nr:metallophosphoesterase [Hymenobacter jeongseonensis]MBF9239344.1 metallophosphoesterase [Hymenobacter jeongseonensis]
MKQHFLRNWSKVRGRGLLLGAGLAVLAGCDLIEFSPNQTHSPDAYSDLTAKNLAALAQRPVPTAGDTLRFVFTGDSQRFYEEAEDLVRSVNRQRGIALLLVAGDISDFGLGREMRWVHDKLKHLRVPYLTVVGNHDHAANGRKAYQEVFGALDYSFTHARTRFIMLNTNSREYRFDGTVPNISWLERQLADTAGVRRQIIINHVPPMDGDFDPQLEQPYVRALEHAPRVVLALNGHRHSFSIGEPYRNGITFINSYSFERRRYVVLTLWGDHEFRLDTVDF